MNNTWLGKLYRKNKMLSVAAGSFFLLTIIANFIQLETTPFFVWDMYKNPIRDTAAQEIYLVQYNHNKLLNFKTTWKEPQKIYLTSPLLYYISWKENGNKEKYREYMETHWAAKHPSFKWILPYLYNSSSQFEAFPEWYRRYLASVTGDEISSVAVIRKKVEFTKENLVREISSDTLQIIP